MMANAALVMTLPNSSLSVALAPTISSRAGYSAPSCTSGWSESPSVLHEVTPGVGRSAHSSRSTELLPASSRNLVTFGRPPNASAAAFATARFSSGLPLTR